MGVSLAGGHAALPVLGDGLWEVRTSLPSKRIARVSFSVQQVRILVLQGFIKKTQQTAGRSGPWAPQKP